MSWEVCAVCGGKAVIEVRVGCARVPCHGCKGRGTVFRPAPALLPAIPPGVPSQDGNRPSKGGEDKITKWIGMALLALVPLACVYPALSTAAPADAGADVRTAPDALAAAPDVLAAPDALAAPDVLAAPDALAAPDVLAVVDLRAAADLRPAVDLPADEVGRPMCPPVDPAHPRANVGTCCDRNTVYGGLLYAWEHCSVWMFDFGDGGFAPLPYPQCYRNVNGLDEWKVSDCSHCPGTKSWSGCVEVTP